MKNALIVVLALIASTGAFAKDIASYRFALRDQDGQHTTITHIVSTLTDERILKLEVTKSEGQFPFFMDNVGQTEFVSKRLSGQTFNLLKRQVQLLSQAEIKRVTSEMVCMMMPSAELSNNHLTVRRGWNSRLNDYTGEMELVFGPRGCWVANKVFPKDDYALEAGVSLKSYLQALSLELANDQMN